MRDERMVAAPPEDDRIIEEHHRPTSKLVLAVEAVEEKYGSVNGAPDDDPLVVEMHRQASKLTDISHAMLEEILKLNRQGYGPVRIARMLHANSSAVANEIELYGDGIDHVEEKIIQMYRFGKTRDEAKQFTGTDRRKVEKLYRALEEADFIAGVKRGLKVVELADRFGITYNAAFYRIAALKKKGIV